jgi:hypothetical protein
VPAPARITCRSPTAGDRGYAAWRDGGFTIHDISDPAWPKLLSHINWSPPFPGGTHTPWVPPVPQKLIDPRPNVGLAAKTCDVFATTDGLMYVTDWNDGMHVLRYEG